MEKFTKLTAVAAALPMANVDTDKVIPSRFLKTIKRTGLGAHLFDTLRYDHRDGSEVRTSCSTTSRGGGAGMLVAGDNFGCGSSREHAPWALLDFGISA